MPVVMKSTLTCSNFLSLILILLFFLTSQFAFAQSVLVKGNVVAPDGTSISNVEIAPNVFTDDAGYYEFTVESELLMEPFKAIDDAVLDCLSNDDLELFQMIIIDNSVPNFYDQLVMDINNSNSGTTIDFVFLSQAIENSFISDQFEWYLFTQSSYDNYPNPTSGSTLQSSYLVNDFTETEIVVDWIAFLEGNVDGDYLCKPVSVKEDILSTSVSLFPNPINSHLNINLPIGIEVQVSIFNVLGKQIKQSYLINDATEIDFSNLVNGIYFVELGIGDSKRTFKIVKE